MSEYAHYDKSDLVSSPQFLAQPEGHSGGLPHVFVARLLANASRGAGVVAVRECREVGRYVARLYPTRRSSRRVKFFLPLTLICSTVPSIPSLYFHVFAVNTYSITFLRADGRVQEQEIVGILCWHTTGWPIPWLWRVTNDLWTLDLRADLDALNGMPIAAVLGLVLLWATATRSSSRRRASSALSCRLWPRDLVVCSVSTWSSAQSRH